MDYEKVMSDIKSLSKKITELDMRAQLEGRDLTPEEDAACHEMLGAIDAMERSLPRRPLTLQDGILGSHFSAGSRQNAGHYAMVPPNGKKDWASMFGNSGYRWPDNETNFFQAALSGRYHPGLIRAAMTEGVPSSGGFLVPQEQSARIHAVSLENEIVQPRCFVQPMNSDSIKIPAMVIGDHSTALFGGFTASYTAEAGTISEHDPKARSMELNAKKLTGLIRFTSELNADTPGGMSQIETLCGKGLSWYRDKAFLKGTGAGEPLGILNASCVIEVAKESGQKADSIIFENLVKMMSRMFAGSFQNSVWIFHQTAIPQLLTLSLAVGTGGAPVPVMTESNGQFKILTRPCIFTEKTETLGDRGDALLCDFSQYVVGMRSEMRFDTSIHVHFTTDELLSRIIERHDGQPLWDSALTLEDGSTTVSPFVVLGAR